MIRKKNCESYKIKYVLLMSAQVYEGNKMLGYSMKTFHGFRSFGGCNKKNTNVLNDRIIYLTKFYVI